MNLQPTYEAILALCDDRASESHSLEFKLKQPGKLEQDKAELAKDVLALANGGGGTILFGISEGPDGAESIQPITDENADSLTRRIGQTLDSLVEPRLDKLEQHVIQTPGGGFVLLIEIGGSIGGPYRINLGNKCRFPLREASYVRDMTYEEIRSSFLKENEISERMRDFRSDRCAAVSSEDATAENRPAKCLIHTIPLSVIRGGQSFDLKAAENNWSQFINHEWGGGSHLFNLDGFMAYRRSEKPSDFIGYCQVYRSGIVETCLRASGYWEEGQGIIPALALCKGIESSIFSAVREYREQGLTGPMLIFLSLVSVKERELAVGDRFRLRANIADRDLLPIPEVLVRDLTDSDQIAEAQRYLYDILWQSFGYSGCNYYDESGKWRPPQ